MQSPVPQLAELVRKALNDTVEVIILAITVCLLAVTLLKKLPD